MCDEANCMQGSVERVQTRRGFLARAAAALTVPVLCAGRGEGAIVKQPLPAFDLSFLDDSIPLMRRDVWASQSARAWLLREGGVFDRITIHHKGGSPSVSRIQNAVAAEIDGISAGHLQRKFGDIAYHFIVDYAGRVWEGRSLAYEGAHVSCENDHNLGVLVLGNFQKQTPSTESMDVLPLLISALRSRFGIKRHRLYGHRDLGSSVCPGEYLYPHVVALREGDDASQSSPNSPVPKEKEDDS
jgi:hypothetical protein